MALPGGDCHPRAPGRQRARAFLNLAPQGSITAPPDLTTCRPSRPFSRLTGRLTGEMQVSCFVEIMRLFDGRLERAIIFLVLLRRDAWLNGPAGCPALRVGDAPQGISINAVATSLDRPFESIRRRVNAMMADGICARGRHGVVVTAFDRPEFLASLDRIHDSMVRLIEHFHAFGIPLPETRADTAYDRHATIIAAIDLMLGALEFVAPLFESWRDMLAVNAVIIANARPITFDRTLAFRYAERDTPPPASLREPVSISALARGLGMPYASVHRLVERGRVRGQIVDWRGGVMAATQFLGEDIVGTSAEQITGRAVQAIARLAAGGFRFDDPARCYINGKPPLVKFR